MGKLTAQDGVNIVNSILEHGSEEMQMRVPVATLVNITDVGNPIINYASVKNEFLKNLVDMIVYTFIRTRVLANNLSVLKQGTVPLGRDIQEIAVNPAKDVGFDPEGSDLMERAIPDVLAAYHRRNRQGKYKATISDEQMTEAFTSWDTFNLMVAGIMNSLYSGDNFDEFILMKNLFGSAATGGKMPLIDVTTADTTGDSAKIILSLQNASSFMQFPGSDYNGYKLINPTAPDPFVTATPIEDQIIVIRSDIKNKVGIEVLAAAFNFKEVEYRSRVVEVDNFHYQTGVEADGKTAVFTKIPQMLAVVMDRSYPQVYDNKNVMRDFYNGSGLYRTFFWHHWQTYSISPFANAVSLVNGALPPPYVPTP